MLAVAQPEHVRQLTLWSIWCTSHRMMSLDLNEPILDAAEIEAFLEAHFPEAVGYVEIVRIDAGGVTVRLRTRPEHLRPGGTVSGPTLMTLADTAMYFLVLSLVGPKALAVTTSLNINFLRRPEPGSVIAKASLLKRGKQLVVGQVSLTLEGAADPVAHATVTYALPPPGKG